MMRGHWAHYWRWTLVVLGVTKFGSYPVRGAQDLGTSLLPDATPVWVWQDYADNIHYKDGMPGYMLLCMAVRGVCVWWCPAAPRVW
eukprot:m.253462 g.253462  ORF g.253462 m.253462 type:complete len:86 (-) comp26518_c0_seq2:60-317(-)